MVRMESKYLIIALPMEMASLRWLMSNAATFSSVVRSATASASASAISSAVIASEEPVPTSTSSYTDASSRSPKVSSIQVDISVMGTASLGRLKKDRSM